MRTLLDRLEEVADSGDRGKSCEDSAVVAVVLDAREAPPSVLLVKRRVDERDPWSGQVALPGGRSRPEDGALVNTVKRELWEEVGLKIGEDVELVGSMTTLTPSNAPSLVVQPFICLVRRDVDIILGPELSKYFWASLRDFRRRIGSVFSAGRRGVMTVPVYVVGSEVVWGMTANIFRRLFEYLEPIP
ncbi:MAG: CoA pyrophosphatase [Nitrososphaerota archaeon]